MKAKKSSKSSLISVENIRREISILIKQHESHKIGVVDQLMKKYKGREITLYKELCKQYKQKPEDLKPHSLKEDYSIGAKLGTGGFAVVRKCKRKKDSKIFALKVINKKNLEKDDLSVLESEVNIMKICNHPNIVSLFDIYESGTKLCLVLSLMLGGELFDRIVDEGHFTENKAASQFVQLLSALSYLHQIHIVHRDLKPENLLYETKDKNSSIKLIDFGLAGSIEKELLKTPCGTPNYVAPEILHQKRYGTPVDMWSIGVILYIILCGFPPFYDENEDLGRLYKKIKKAQFNFPSPYWDPVSKDAKDLIKKLLEVDPKKRLTANAALKHPWCSGKASEKAFNKNQLFHLRRFQYIRKFKRGVRCVLAVCKLINVLEDSTK